MGKWTLVATRQGPGECIWVQILNAHSKTHSTASSGSLVRALWSSGRLQVSIQPTWHVGGTAERADHSLTNVHDYFIKPHAASHPRLIHYLLWIMLPLSDAWNAKFSQCAHINYTSFPNFSVEIISSIPFENSIKVNKGEKTLKSSFSGVFFFSLKQTNKQKAIDC